MKAALRKARTYFSTYYAMMLEYRAELVFWMLAGLLPFILMGVWVKASESGQFPLSSLDFARYFVAVFFVRQMTVVWVIFEFEREVNEGRLSPFLLQPIDPVWRHVASHITERFARWPFLVTLLVLFFLWQPEVFWVPNLGGGLLACLAMFMAFSLRFVIQYTMAILAFWTERASSIQSFWFLFYLFLSGLIAPLEVFPDTVRRIAYLTPFPYLVAFPARLLVGRHEGAAEVVPAFVTMIVWGLLFLVLNRFLWHRGLKHYSAMGA